MRRDSALQWDQNERVNSSAAVQSELVEAGDGWISNIGKVRRFRRLALAVDPQETSAPATPNCTSLRAWSPP